MGFLTLSDCGEEVSDHSPLSPELRLAMTKTIEPVHARHVWHGDLHLRKFLHGRETDLVVLADFSAAQLLDGPDQALDDELAHFCGTLLDCPPPAGSVPACTARDVLRHCPLASTPALNGFLLNMCVTFSTQKPLFHLDVLTLS